MQNLSYYDLKFLSHNNSSFVFLVLFLLLLLLLFYETQLNH